MLALPQFPHTTVSSKLAPAFPIYMRSTQICDQVTKLEYTLNIYSNIEELKHKIQFDIQVKNLNSNINFKFFLQKSKEVTIIMRQAPLDLPSESGAGKHQSSHYALFAQRS